MNKWIPWGLDVFWCLLMVGPWFAYLRGVWRFTVDPTQTVLGRISSKYTVYLSFVLCPIACIGSVWLVYRLQQPLDWLGLPRPLSAEGCFGVGIATLGLSSMAFVGWKAWRHTRLTRHTWPRCQNCRYILRGLSRKDGQILCPECGHRQSVEDVANHMRYDRAIRRWLRLCVRDCCDWIRPRQPKNGRGFPRR